MSLLTKYLVHTSLVIVLVAGLAPSVASQPANVRASVAGKWVLDVRLPGAPATPTITLKQQGEKLTGHYSGARIGEQQLNGRIKGADFEFTVEGETSAGPVTLVFKGTLTTTDAMKGMLRVSGGANGTFSGKRVKS